MSEDHAHAASGIMCGHVFEGSRPLRLIEHTPDGEWDFMCGEDDHDTAAAISAAVVVCKGCAMAQMVLPHSVHAMPKAHRAVYDPSREVWSVRPLTGEEIAEYREEA